MIINYLIEDYWIFFMNNSLLIEILSKELFNSMGLKKPKWEIIFHGELTYLDPHEI